MTAAVSRAPVLAAAPAQHTRTTVIPATASSIAHHIQPRTPRTLSVPSTTGGGNDSRRLRDRRHPARRRLRPELGQPLAPLRVSRRAPPVEWRDRRLLDHDAFTTFTARATTHYPPTAPDSHDAALELRATTTEGNSLSPVSHTTTSSEDLSCSVSPPDQRRHGYPREPHPRGASSPHALTHEIGT